MIEKVPDKIFYTLSWKGLSFALENTISTIINHKFFRHFITINNSTYRSQAQLK